VLLGLLLATLLVETAAARPEYSEESAAACIECHETPSVMGILDTAHAKVADPRTPAAQKECQSCHGPSAVHMRFPMQVANVHFGEKSKTRPAEQNKMCLECHDSGEQKDWQGSAHGFEDVVCSSCHSMHDPAKIVPAEATLSTGCTTTCHTDLMKDAAAEDFSHAVGQSLGENGELTCAGCHNPHGPLDSHRCLDCHPREPELMAKESAKARRFHEVAQRKGTDCIRCHKGIAHPIPPLALEQADVEMKRLVAP